MRNNERMGSIMAEDKKPIYEREDGLIDHKKYDFVEVEEGRFEIQEIVKEESKKKENA